MHHTVTAVHDRDRTNLNFACQSEPGADCRVACVEPGCGAEGWPCYSNDGPGGGEREHPRADQGTCQILLWDALNECGPDDTPIGIDTPVTFWFNGDDYEWDVAK